jgi:hypothetical protein
VLYLFYPVAHSQNYPNGKDGFEDEHWADQRASQVANNPHKKAANSDAIPVREFT